MILWVWTGLVTWVCCSLCRIRGGGVVVVVETGTRMGSGDFAKASQPVRGRGTWDPKPMSHTLQRAPLMGLSATREDWVPGLALSLQRRAGWDSFEQGHLSGHSQATLAPSWLPFP